MSGASDELIRVVETVKAMLVATATGQQCVGDYGKLRQQLIANPTIKDKVPPFVRTCRTLDEFWGFIKPKFAHYYQRREFIREAFDPLLSFLEQSSTAPSDEANAAILTQVDSTHVQQAWQKALDRRTSDPEGAITAARTLLETVCKHILDRLGHAYDDKMDLPKLYGEVACRLNLSPSQHTERIFKQVLGGCHSVVEGLGAMRSKLGDAHGFGKAAVRPAPRHAELAVNLAGTMGTFLLATWDAWQKRVPPAG